LKSFEKLAAPLLLLGGELEMACFPHSSAGRMNSLPELGQLPYEIRCRLR
jgi:hypothetical protein